MVNHTLVDTLDALGHALGRVDAPVVGLDVERTAAPRYFKPAALVQVGTADHAVLLDTHVLGPLPTVGEFLGDRTVVLHAGTNDIESLDGADMTLDRVEDTAIAAALLGLPRGLDPLLDEVLGVRLDGDKDRFQRANWERRPLPSDMAAYAAGDVVHLPALVDELAERLDDLGRTEWYRQECDHMLADTRAATRTWEDTGGLGRLDPDQRAIARAVWERREELARSRDDAPQVVLRDDTIVDVAANPPDDPDELRRRNDRRGPDRATAEQLLEAVRSGAAASPEPVEDQPAGSVDTRVARDRHAAMRKARAAVARELGIDSGVLAPGRVLWAPIHAAPASADELAAALDLRPWQKDLVVDALWEAHESVPD